MDRETLGQLVENGREVEFRDGPQMIPAYLADLMAGLPTFKMTKEEAVDAANKKQLRNAASSAYDAAIKTHFGGQR